MTAKDNWETGVAIITTLFFTALAFIVAWIKDRQSIPDPDSEK